MEIKIVTLGVTAIGSGAAALAATAAWRSAIATQRAAEGQLLLALLAEYSRPDIRQKFECCRWHLHR